jgi:hypothetical protein
MDSIETIDAIFEDLYNNLNIYTKSKHNNKLKEELNRVKLCILEIAGSNCIDSDKIIKAIQAREMALE